MVKMEMPEVEMGDNTGAGEELWEGLGVEDKEGMDEGKGKDEKTGEDLVSGRVLSIVVC